MAAVTMCSDFGAQENKVCHCFLCFPIYLPRSDGTRCHDLSFLILLLCIFLCGSADKESACNVGDLGSIPGLGRSPGEGKGYPLQYSGLENPMDCIIDEVTESQTQLSDFPFYFPMYLAIQFENTYPYTDLYTSANKKSPKSLNQNGCLWMNE